MVAEDYIALEDNSITFERYLGIRYREYESEDKRLTDYEGKRLLDRYEKSR